MQKTTPARNRELYFSSRDEGGVQDGEGETTASGEGMREPKETSQHLAFDKAMFSRDKGVSV